MELIYLGLLFFQLVSLNLVFSQQNIQVIDEQECGKGPLDLIQINVKNEINPLNGEHYFNGFLNYHVPLNENVGMLVTFNQIDGDKSEGPIEKYFENACEALLSILQDAFVLANSHCLEGECLNSSQEISFCPLKSGIFGVTQVSKSMVDNALSSVFSLPKGQWEATFNYIRTTDNAILGCFKFILLSS